MAKTIPMKMRKAMDLDPEYRVCSLQDKGGCGGRITREHALIYANNKIQERWAIIPLCARHHAVDFYQDAGTMDKEKNVWVALNRATDEELLKYSKVINYIRERARLNEIYGAYTPPSPPPSTIAW